MFGKHKTLILVLTIALTLGITGIVFAQDRDGDGVGDSRDRCPDVWGPTITMGCPIVAVTPDTGGDTGGGSSSGDTSTAPDQPPPPDSDGDGTADPLDACPTVPGDGANAGCPEGQNGNTQPQETISLVAMPTDGLCVVSPGGAFNVNIRQQPLPDASIVGILVVNEIVEVLGTHYPQQPNDQTVWYLIQANAGMGWVAGSVVRTGGDCSIFDDPDEGVGLIITMKKVLVSSLADETSGDESNTATYCVIEPGAEAGMWVEVCYEIELDEGCFLTTAEAGVWKVECEDDEVNVNPLLGELNLDIAIEDGAFLIGFPVPGPDDLLAPDDGCELTSPEAGVYILDCGEDDTNTATYCVIEPGAEAGMWVEVCYEIELEDGCVLTTAEAGVWKIECEEDDPISINPLIGTLPGLGIQAVDNQMLLTFPAPKPDDLLAPDDGCELITPEAGVYILDCGEETNTATYCVIEEVGEAGMFEEVCYEIELEDGCILTTAEAGVWKIECEEDDAISINPLIGNLPGLGIQAVDNQMLLTFPAPDPNPNDLLAPDDGCELTSPEAGVFILDCGEEETNTATYCVIEEVGEAGMFEEVCYEIELEDGCILTSAEAGVWKIECEEEGGVKVNPLIGTLPGIGFAPETNPNSLDLIPDTPTEDPNDLLAPDDGCELTSPEAGVFILDCGEEETNTATYCVIEEVGEAGMFEEVCYEIELEDGCILTTAEAGVWKIECEEDDPISINPIIGTLPGLIFPPGTGPDAIPAIEEAVTIVGEIGTEIGGTNPLDLMAPDDGCELVSPEAGVYIMDCEEDDDSGTATYCVIEEVGEAGMFEEVCYEIELEDGCVLTTAEAGVWKIECEEDDEVSVNPSIETLPDISFAPAANSMEMSMPAPNPNDLMAPDDGCELVSPEAGVFILDCEEDDDSNTATYCVIEEVGEAGMFEEVCYEIELEDGCVLTTAEAGVWKIECEEDGEVSVNPNIGTLPNLSVAGSGGMHMTPPQPNPGDLMAPDDGCELVSPEAGVYIMDCEEDDDSGTATYCVIEEVGEAGMFEEVCYEIELEDGCVLTTAEAGVWKIECEEDDPISINPLLEDMPGVILSQGDDGPYAALLLPAIQASREG